MPKAKKKYPYVEWLVTITLLVLLLSLAVTYHQKLKPTLIPRSAIIEEPVRYLMEEGTIILVEKDGQEEIIPVEKVLFEYIEVTDGCGPHFEGACLNVRAQPSTSSPVVAQLRTGVVLKVGGKVVNDGIAWYQIEFDEWLRYPERVTSDWYVAADYVEILYDEGAKDGSIHEVATSSKQIIVDRSDQKIYAYDGDEFFMETDISTGLELSPTPRGNFTIFRKTPSRYMQGPLPYLENSDYYDLPGVPWNLYFTEQGAVIHGAYWHESFGTQYSHGCVNTAPSIARELYHWADLGTKVLVRD